MDAAQDNRLTDATGRSRFVLDAAATLSSYVANEAALSDLRYGLAVWLCLVEDACAIYCFVILKQAVKDSRVALSSGTVVEDCATVEVRFIAYECAISDSRVAAATLAEVI